MDLLKPGINVLLTRSGEAQAKERLVATLATMKTFP